MRTVLHGITKKKKQNQPKYNVFTQKPLIVLQLLSFMFQAIWAIVKELPVVLREDYKEFILHIKIQHLRTYTVNVNVNVQCKNLCLWFLAS